MLAFFQEKSPEFQGFSYFYTSGCLLKKKLQNKIPYEIQQYFIKVILNTVPDPAFLTLLGLMRSDYCSDL